jgi:protein-S-isoprenylcysteine O-methyltransferase Ste14
MMQSTEHSLGLRRRVVMLFFLGLFLMAVLAVGISRVCADWGRVYLGWPNQMGGAALISAGLILVVLSVNIQYTFGEGTPAPKVATQRLITHGPYAYTRNPMTLGALLMYLGIGVWTGSGVVVILTVFVFSGLLTFIHIHETQELTERFGNEYLEYRKRTPFLLPRCRR